MPRSAKQSRTTVTTAGRQIAGVVNCMKPGSAAGESASYGGVGMSTAGITLATGMITIMIATSPVARRYASNNP